MYPRVSSHKQKEDLERQADYLRSLYPGAILFKDIGGGLNFKRKGLEALLGQILSGDLREVVV
ncbi:MAG: recombinase family protein, partial [Microcoleaceae cyanobacterium]